MPPLAPDEPVRVRDRLVVRRVGGELFVLAPDSSMHHFENASAVAIWDHLASTGPSGATPRDVAQRLVAAFCIAPDEAEREAAAFVQTLLDAGLCERP